MRITTKQFALSLYEAVAEKSNLEVRQTIKKFVEILDKKNQLGVADKITAEFIKIWNKKHGIIEAIATSAKGLAKADIKLLKDYVANLSGAKEVLVSEKIDKNILSGVVIKYGDRVLDGSLKRQLLELKDKLTR